MDDDYRNTEYCEPLGDIGHRKNNVVAMVMKDHPGARDLHRYISKNDSEYKKKFIKAYHGKCAYCGVSIAIVPKQFFEVDHFIYRKSSKFNSKEESGFIDNLVLACHRCNHEKGALEISDSACEYLHPDKPGIKDTFIRDSDFYIRISDGKKMDPNVKKFYEKLDLGAEVHRLDYLLMSMRGLRTQIEGNSAAYKYITEAIDILQTKRNLDG